MRVRARKTAGAAVASLGLLLPTSVALGDQIPGGQGPSSEVFIGHRTRPRPISFDAAPKPPRHPFMAPNDRSNIHDDAYQTDSADWTGPLGRDMWRDSIRQDAECATLTFDRGGRIETVCVGVQRPKLVLMNPRTLDPIESYQLPKRQAGPCQPTTCNPFTDFSGGGYFYLDRHDRAVVVTNNQHVFVIEQRPGPRFKRVRDYSLRKLLDDGDKLVAVMPDWHGLLWVVTREGVIVTINPHSGHKRKYNTHEGISNSFAVDESGGVYIVTDGKESSDTGTLYRFRADRHGRPEVTWKEKYRNGPQKPGQSQRGSGTTPTLMGSRYVAITDNDEPMHVLVFKRRKGAHDRRVCKQAVFGADGATDNSLIGTRRSLIVENNFGYTIASEESTPGVWRVDIDRDHHGCHVVWRNDEVSSPSVVPKLSLRNGLVYVYTHHPELADGWYLTALNFRTGKLVYMRLAGRGPLFNNNYAPVTIGRHGRIYVGVLAGLVALGDADPRSHHRPGRHRPGR